MKIFLYLLSVVFLGGILPTFPTSDGVVKKQEANIVFCQFSLSDDIMEAHTSFTVRYSFKLDENGKPKDIKKILGDQLSNEQISECLSKWQFSNMASDTLLIAYFRWEHAIGWTELTVSGKGFSQKIKIEGVRCPYSKADETSK